MKGKKIDKQKFEYIAFTWMILHLWSCQSFEKYNSNWIIYRFERYGIDEIDSVGLCNFAINPELKVCRPPGIDINGKSWDVSSCKIKLERTKGKDSMTIYSYGYFKGKFLIECLNEDCCTISLSNDSLYFVLDYNLPDIVGKPRKCPTPRVN